MKRYSFLPSYLICFFLLQITCTIQAQSSYMQLDNAVGTSPSSTIVDSLDVVSNSLSDLILFSGGVSDFTVYDFGFYVYNEIYEAGYPDVFQEAVASVSTSNKPFLFLGRQIALSGQTMKIWVDFQFDASEFDCIDEENISEVLQLKANYLCSEANSLDAYYIENVLIKYLEEILEEGFCCSGYYDDIKGSEAEHKMFNGSCGVDSNKIDSIIAILVDNQQYWTQISLFLEVYQFFKQCQNEEWSSKEPNGIVPYCFWKESTPIIPYVIGDFPYWSGVTDGLYSEAVGVYETLMSLDDFGESLANLVMSYTLYYLICEHGLEIGKTDWIYSMEVIGETFWENNILQEVYIEMIITIPIPSQQKAVNIFSSIPNINIPFGEFVGVCDKLEDVRASVERIAGLITNIDFWLNLYTGIKSAVGEMWENASGFSNEERYYQGFYGIKAALIFLPITKGKFFDDIASYWAQLIKKINGNILYKADLHKLLGAKYFKKIKGKSYYSKLDGDYQKILESDCVLNSIFAKYIDEVGEEGVEVWKKMIDLNADDAIRTNPGAIDALRMPKGSPRPNPSTYLDSDYIDNHIEMFEQQGIASRIVSKDSYTKNGVGKPDAGKTEFVAPKSEIDEILNLPLNEKAEKLGIPVSQLQNKQLVRIDFDIGGSNTVKMPSGNEWGANEKWIPGGKSSGGTSEAIVETIDMQLGVDYFVNDL